MAEQNQSFLEILNNYFSKLDDNQIVAGSKQRIVIPMDWLFLEKTPRELIDTSLIEKAFINLICKANKSYRSKLKRDKYFYGKISSLEIEKSTSGVNLVINARDGWTKIVVTADKNLRGPFYAINEDRLYEEILREYNYKSVGQECAKNNWSMEKREDFLAMLKQEEINQGRKNWVISKLGKVAENLTEYYDYMSQKKNQYETEVLNGAIQQKTDKGYKGAITGTIRNPRKSEIHDFIDRDQILMDMGPSCVIILDRVEKDNSVTKFAYKTYVYPNPRGKKGYLFIAEPGEGDHNTRVRFVPVEEFEKIKAGEGQQKFVHIAESITEMSTNEFIGSRFSKILKHTSIEKYQEKLRRIVLGEPVQKPSEEQRYAEMDRIIFDGAKRKITTEEIAHKASGTTLGKVQKARDLLYSPTKDIALGETSVLQ